MASNAQNSYDMSIINEWVNYNDVIRKQLFIYAKRGDIKKFKELVNLYNIRSFTRLKIPVAQRPDGIHNNKTRKRIQRKILNDSSSDKGSSEQDDDQDDSEDEEQKLIKASSEISLNPSQDVD